MNQKNLYNSSQSMRVFSRHQRSLFLVKDWISRIQKQSLCSTAVSMTDKLIWLLDADVS
ncbi:hypothetical protein [Halotia branconii]|uniref:Uncharacterized protein n=1 Tax=Halotia branconii CENA392 TaxID=1539056 RepID=A0AAJ6P913_9CYAN|nr:hypothetical protein [Halotia branconii]WGV25349.1 hypothetical protein QI031_26990 [Halotia branconii CENA392]